LIIYGLSISVTSRQRFETVKIY